MLNTQMAFPSYAKSPSLTPSNIQTLKKNKFSIRPHDVKTRGGPEHGIKDHILELRKRPGEES